MNPIISLDVGGTVFRATMSTLCSVEGYFSLMLGDGQWSEAQDFSKPIFIDRGNDSTMMRIC